MKRLFCKVFYRITLATKDASYRIYLYTVYIYYQVIHFMMIECWQQFFKYL